MMNLSSAFSIFSSKKYLLISMGFLLAGFLRPALADEKTSPSAITDHKAVKRGDPVAEAEIDKRFNANPNTRGLRNILYAYIPDLLKQCPTWDSEMKDWHRCEAVVPVAAIVKFRNKLRKEPLETRIQQWFFLDAIGGIERPNDDMVRAKSFLSKYFAKIILHELHDDNGWCYGPSWVGHSQKAWMPCAEIPDFESRTLPQWALYTPPKNHPRPTWPGTFDDTAPDEAGPMQVPAKVIEQAAKPAPQTGHVTKSYKGEDDNLASLPALPAQKAPVDPGVLLQRAQEISNSKEGAALLAKVLTGNPAERQEALTQASQLLKMSPSEVAETARALKSSPQGMLILQQIQQLASAPPEERQQSMRQVAGLLGVKPEEAQKVAQNVSNQIAAQSSDHPDATQQLLDQAKKIVSDPQVLQRAENALGSHSDEAKEAANSTAGRQALSEVSSYIENAQQEKNDQPGQEDLNQADTGVFEIDKHDPNKKSANAGGDRDLLSYPHPDGESPGIGENNYGNSEDRNSKGAQYHAYSEDNASDNASNDNNFKDASQPVNNPAEDGVAQSGSGSVDMSSMPDNLPTPQSSASRPNPSPFAGNDGTSAPQKADQTASQTETDSAAASPATSWQQEAFGGGESANPYGNANFAPPQNGSEPQGENSPPAHQNLGEIGDKTEGEAVVNGQKIAPQAYQKTASTTRPAQETPEAPPPAEKRKLKIITEGDTDDGNENGDWKVIKR